MSYKLTCPVCDAYTSLLFRAYENGHLCPYCGSSLEECSEQYYRQLLEMSDAYEAAKRAVLATSRDPECEHCKAYVDELIRTEMESRSDPVLNTLGANWTSTYHLLLVRSSGDE